MSLRCQRTSASIDNYNKPRPGPFAQQIAQPGVPPPQTGRWIENSLTEEATDMVCDRRTRSSSPGIHPTKWDINDLRYSALLGVGDAVWTVPWPLLLPPPEGL